MSVRAAYAFQRCSQTRTIHSDGPFEPREPREQDELPQEEVGADERGEPPDRVEPVGQRLHRDVTARQPPEQQDHPEADEEDGHDRELSRPARSVRLVRDHERRLPHSPIA